MFTVFTIHDGEDTDKVLYVGVTSSTKLKTYLRKFISLHSNPATANSKTAIGAWVTEQKAAKKPIIFKKQALCQDAEEANFIKERLILANLDTVLNTRLKQIDELT